MSAEIKENNMFNDIVRRPTKKSFENYKCLSFHIYTHYDGYEEQYNFDILTNNLVHFNLLNSKIGKWIKN